MCERGYRPVPARGDLEVEANPDATIRAEKLCNVVV
jgi:hypothetical protein